MAAVNAYGGAAVAVGITVKLVRALWIFPLAFIGTRLTKSETKPRFQWFLLAFLAAGIITSILPEQKDIWKFLSTSGKHLMAGTLFLVGNLPKSPFIIFVSFLFKSIVCSRDIIKNSIYNMHCTECCADKCSCNADIFFPTHYCSPPFYFFLLYYTKIINSRIGETSMLFLFLNVSRETLRRNK